MAKILVVDDRATNRQYLVTLLGYCGHETLEAANGAVALDMVRSQKPDLVISDILMPTMDGYELALALRGMRERPHIIFYTATYSGPTARQMAASCGVEAVLIKPCEPAEMLATVNRVLDIATAPVVAAPPQSPASAASLPADYNLAKYISKLEATKRGFDDIVRNAAPAAAHDLAAAQAEEFATNIADMRRLLFRLTVLIEVSSEAVAERDAAKLVEIFFGAACEIISADYAAIAIFDEHTRGLRCLYTKGVDAGLLRRMPRHGVLGKLAADRQALRWRRSAPRFAAIDLPPEHPPVDALLGLPIASLGQHYGWLYFAGAAEFGEEDQRFAAILVEKLALIYENALFYDQVQSHAAQMQMEIARRALAEGSLRESEQRFRQLADNVREVFFLDAIGGETLYVSPAYEDIWGRSRDSLYAAPRSWTEAIHPADRAAAMANYEQALRTTGQYDHEFRIVRPDASVRWIRARGFPARNAAGEIYRIAGICEDVTERREQQERIDRLSRIRQVLGGINAAIVRVHERAALLAEACRIAVLHGRFALAAVVAVDAASGALAPLAAEGIDAAIFSELRLAPGAELGTLDQALASGKPVFCNDLAAQPAPGSVGQTLLERGYRSVIWLPLHAGGKVAAVLVLAVREADFFDADELLLLEELAGDVSFALEHIARAEQINYLAYYDVLTGLPNGTLFQDRLGQFLHAIRPEAEKGAVIVVDLDRFTHINDTLGRHVGDMLLKLVAQRLNEALTECCSLARIGANTFAVATAGLRHASDAAGVLEERIFEPLAQPFHPDGSEVRLVAHAGIAVFPDDGNDAHTLLKHAELALKQAKASPQRFLYHSAQANARAAEKIALEHQLREAVKREQFVLHFQPKVDLVSGYIVGAEALIRWQHPERGLVAPEEFIPLAEESGLIEPIGDWVVKSLCAHQAAWIARFGSTVPIAFNLSARQLLTAGVLVNLRQELARHGLDIKCLAAELTESAVMVNLDEAMRTLTALQQMGVALSLDDFGTGYSSLAHLKRFPFDFVKIDKSFITDIVKNPEDAAIAKAIIAMAHLLNLHVVAEGVETQAQVDYLRASGCDEMQGYFFSRPVPGDVFEGMLQAGKRLAPALAAGAEALGGEVA